jgi:hypothetical protein
LSEGGTQVMRCAKLLAYLMIEFEVPVVVRHAIRCARIFFFGLVDFHKLDLYQEKEVQEIISAMTRKEGQIETITGTNTEGNSSIEGELEHCCKNKFILATLKKIGQRISESGESGD